MRDENLQVKLFCFFIFIKQLKNKASTDLGGGYYCFTIIEEMIYNRRGKLVQIWGVAIIVLLL